MSLRELIHPIVTAEGYLPPSKRLRALFVEKGFKNPDELIAQYRRMATQIKNAEDALPPIDRQMVDGWLNEGVIRNGSYVPVAHLLGIKGDIKSALMFSGEQRLAYLKNALTDTSLPPHVGFYADFFAYLFMTSNSEMPAFCKHVGISEESFNAIISGNVIPTLRVMKNINRAMQIPFNYDELMKKFGIEDFRKKRPSTKRFELMLIVGDIDTETHIADVAKKLFSSGSPYATLPANLERHKPVISRLLNISAQDLKLGVTSLAAINELIDDIFKGDDAAIIKRVLAEPKVDKTFEQVFKEYIALGNPTPQGFVDHLATKWNMSRDMLGRTLGYSDGKGLRAFGSHGVYPAIIERVFQYAQVKDEEVKLDFFALVKGRQPYMSIKDICDQAEEVLLLKDDQPVPEGNAVYERMIRKGFLKGDKRIDKEKISCAVCDIIYEKRGLSQDQIQERSKGKYEMRYLNPIREGQKTITIHTQGRIEVEFPQKAKDFASTYTSDAALMERLGLLLQGIVKKRTLSDMLPSLSEGLLTIGEIVRIYRRQNFLSREEFIERVKAAGGDFTVHTLNNLEMTGSNLARQRDAAAVAKLVGEGSKASEIDEFRKNLMGKVMEKITVAEIEELILKAAKPGSNIKFKDFIEPVKKLLGATSHNELGAMIVCTGKPAGVSGMAVSTWQSGDCVIDSKEVAEAFAGLLGLSEKAEAMFIKISMGIKLEYDYTIVDGLTEDASAADRAKVIKQLRLDIGEQSTIDFAKKMRVGKNMYRAFEAEGGFPAPIEGQRKAVVSRDEFIDKYVRAVVPISMEGHREKLTRILLKPVPLKETGIKPEEVKHSNVFQIETF